MFGKHRGTNRGREVPTDYLDWVLKPKADQFDEDVIFTVRPELERRRQAAAA